MAIGFIRMTTTGGGSPKNGHDYITREGKYAKSRKAEDLVAKGEENLPSWAKDGTDFWKAEEQFRRRTEKKAEKDAERSGKKNEGRDVKRREIVRARHMILALPAELDTDSQKRVLHEFLKENFPDNVTSWAIHHSTGALSGKENPHAHVLICQKKIDRNAPEPTREKYFSQRGGYHVDPRLAGKDRKDHLEAFKKSWERICNRELEKTGREERMQTGQQRPVSNFHLGAAAIAQAAISYGRINRCIYEGIGARAYHAWWSREEKIRIKERELALHQEGERIDQNRERVEEMRPEKDWRGKLNKYLGLYQKWTARQAEIFNQAAADHNSRLAKWKEQRQELKDNPQKAVGTKRMLVKINSRLVDRYEKVYRFEEVRQMEEKKEAEEKLRKKWEQEKLEKWKKQHEAELRRHEAELRKSVTEKNRNLENRPDIGEKELAFYREDLQKIRQEGYALIIPTRLLERIGRARAELGLESDPSVFCRGRCRSISETETRIENQNPPPENKEQAIDRCVNGEEGTFNLRLHIALREIYARQAPEDQKKKEEEKTKKDLEALKRKKWNEYLHEAQDEMRAQPEYQNLLEKIQNHTATDVESRQHWKMRNEIENGDAAKWIAAGKWVKDEEKLQRNGLKREMPYGTAREMIRQRLAGKKDIEEWRQEQERQRQERRRANRGWEMER